MTGDLLASGFARVDAADGIPNVYVEIWEDEDELVAEIWAEGVDEIQIRGDLLR